MIHVNDVLDIYKPKYIWVWLVSAFKAGFINSAGFLATGSFVSQVTGFGTQVGIALGHEDYFFGAEILIIPISFIFGGVVTSFILDGHKDESTPPPYHIVQGLITVVIALVLIVGESKFGKFSPDTPHPALYGLFEFSVISLLCFVCGLINSLIAWTTRGRVRVTHLTGLSTDIGLNLLKMIPFKKNSYFVPQEKTTNLVRIFMFVAFSFGACSSAIIFPQVGYKGFLIVMAISLALTFVAYFDRRRITANQNDLNSEVPFIYGQKNVYADLSASQQPAALLDQQISRAANR